MADGRPFIRPDAPHGVHDLLLIAAYVGRDVTDAERDQAAALVAGCADCAALAADLGDVRVSLAALPPPARHRDFRLTREDAARLRPRGGRPTDGWRRPGLRLAQPFAAGLTMLGLAGLLVTAVPLGADAGGASDGATDNAQLRLEEAAPAASPGDIGITSASEAPAGNEPPVDQALTPAAGGTEEGTANGTSTAPAGSGDPARLAVGIGSAILIVSGAALWFGAQRRRRTTL